MQALSKHPQTAQSARHDDIRSQNSNNSRDIRLQRANGSDKISRRASELALIVGLNTLAAAGNKVFGCGLGRCEKSGGNREGMSQEKMKHWVILFARTGSEEKLRDMLKESLNTDEYLPFVPAKETPFRSKGVIYKVRKPLFPGYIFIQTGIEPDLIAGKLETALRSVEGKKHIYSILHYGNNKKDVVVRDEERLYWERLFDGDFCIQGSVGIIEGDVTRVTSGALMGLEGRIKRINRHKREAVVEMQIMGQSREVALMLEIVEKTTQRSR